jgi:hypothetical protein
MGLQGRPCRYTPSLEPPIMIDVQRSPSGLTWYVLDNDAHRDTATSQRSAQRIAKGLRDGSLVYDSEVGHTVPRCGCGLPAEPCEEWLQTGACGLAPAHNPGDDPLAAMLAEL